MVSMFGEEHFLIFPQFFSPHTITNISDAPNLSSANALNSDKSKILSHGRYFKPAYTATTNKKCLGKNDGRRNHEIDYFVSVPRNGSKASVALYSYTVKLRHSK